MEKQKKKKEKGGEGGGGGGGGGGEEEEEEEEEEEQEKEKTIAGREKSELLAVLQFKPLSPQSHLPNLRPATHTLLMDVCT